MNKTTVVDKRLEHYDVFIGRPTKWGNPFHIGRDGTREEVIKKYEHWLVSYNPHLMCAIKTELQGKILGCYCHPLPCHGDVLARLADDMSDGGA